MPSKRILPPTYLLIAVMMMAVLGFVFPILRVIPPVWNLLGLVPIALGIIINLLADRFFQQVHTTVKPFECSSALAVGSVYSISRNPMYLGFVLILAGIAVLLRAVSPWAVVIAFVILMQRVFIRVEEGMLAEQFGWLWEGYCKHTPRWVKLI